MPRKKREVRAEEFGRLLAELEADLELFRALGSEAPHAKDIKRLLVYYAQNHQRQAWVQATLGLCSAAWLLVLGVNTAKATRTLAARVRGTNLPVEASALELEHAAGLRSKSGVRRASETLRAKKVYNLLAEGCDKCLPPDTNRGKRGKLGEMLLSVRRQMPDDRLALLPKRDRNSSRR